MMKKILGISLILLVVFTQTACTSSEETASTENQLTVAVSIVPEATFVKAVCGDTVNVITMIPPGASPENYEPTPEAFEQFNQADVYFSIGVPTEENGILPYVGENTEVVALDDAVSAVYPERTIDGVHDPHTWLSPKRVAIMIGMISEKMSMIEPEQKELYEENAANYKTELTDLDEQIQTIFANETTNKNFITTHPAYGYFADDYGLTMYALEEDGKEATAQHLQELVNLAEEKDIKTVFYQAETSSEQADAFAESIGGTAIELAPLSADYINNMQEMATSIAESMQ